MDRAIEESLKQEILTSLDSDHESFRVYTDHTSGTAILVVEAIDEYTGETKARRTFQQLNG